MVRRTDNSPLDPGVLNNGDGEVVAIYDWETYAPPSTNGAGGLGFIGMQVSLYRCFDQTSSIDLRVLALHGLLVLSRG